MFTLCRNDAQIYNTLGVIAQVGIIGLQGEHFSVFIIPSLLFYDVADEGGAGWDGFWVTVGESARVDKIHHDEKPPCEDCGYFTPTILFTR